METFTYQLTGEALKRYEERIHRKDFHRSFQRSRFYGYLHQVYYFRDGQAVWIAKQHSGYVRVVTCITLGQFENLFDERGIYIGKRRDGTTRRDRDWAGRGTG